MKWTLAAALASAVLPLFSQPAHAKLTDEQILALPFVEQASALMERASHTYQESLSATGDNALAHQPILNYTALLDASIKQLSDNVANENRVSCEAELSSFNSKLYQPFKNQLSNGELQGPMLVMNFMAVTSKFLPEVYFNCHPSISNSTASSKSSSVSAKQPTEESSDKDLTHSRSEVYPEGIVTQDQLNAYLEYLNKPEPKALASSRFGRSWYYFGQNTLSEARDKALKDCQNSGPKHERTTCHILMENNRVLVPEYPMSSVAPAPKAQAITSPQALCDLQRSFCSDSSYFALYPENQGHKAYALSKDNYSVGSAYNAISPQAAEYLALNKCRANYGYPEFATEDEAGCRVVVLNNQFLPEIF